MNDAKLGDLYVWNINNASPKFYVSKLILHINTSECVVLATRFNGKCEIVTSDEAPNIGWELVRHE